jgi:hypothetical protein
VIATVRTGDNPLCFLLGVLATHFAEMTILLLAAKWGLNVLYACQIGPILSYPVTVILAGAARPSMLTWRTGGRAPPKDSPCRLRANVHRAHAPHFQNLGVGR